MYAKNLESIKHQKLGTLELSLRKMHKRGFITTEWLLFIIVQAVHFTVGNFT